MDKNYKLVEQVITNVIHRHIKLTEHQKQTNSTNTLGKGMNPIILLPAMGK